MDRHIVYIGQSPQDLDILYTNLHPYISIAKLSAAIFGTSTLFNNLVCSPTSPATLAVIVGPGEIYSLQNIDNTAYGSIPIDTTYQILKQGVNLATTTGLNCPAPTIVGDSINYLIQIGFSELDGGSITLPYYDSANPNVPFTGPNNNPVPQFTVRQDTANIAVKAGAPAPTGTQITPSPDSGFTGAYVVTVAYGQTTITSSSISIYAGAPFLTENLLQKLGIADLQSGAAIYAADTGTANTYAAALTPAITAYTVGMKFNIKILHSNTGSSTLNINSIGAETITYTSGSNITANDLLAGMIGVFVFDGTNFQLINPASEAAGGILGQPEGGTGRGSSTAYALIAGATTTTGVLQSVANGASGTMLQGAGTSALPAYSTSTWPTTTTVNQILYSSSANTVSGLSTANDGVFVTSNTGVPSVLAGPGTSGNMLQSNSAAAPSYSTSAWPTTTTINQILYSSSANTVAGITTGNNGVLITSSGGVPSISSTLPSGITLVAPALGTPASGTLTNCTSIPVANATGLLPLANGGFNANITASNGGIFYSTGSAGALLSGTATANQVILSGSSTNPSWSTATFSSTFTASNLLYSNGANTVTGLSTANNGVLITSGTGVPSISSTLPSGITLVAPVLGTPASGALSNCTSIPVANATGNLPLANLTGNATANKALISTASSSAPVYSTPTLPLSSSPSNGQLMIGNGTNFVAATLSAGNNTTITNGTGTITIGTTVASAPITQVTKQVFTGNGTYTPTSGMVFCIAEGVGGGGGGGSIAGNVSNGGFAGGGAGGSYGRVTLTAAQVGASKAISIGSAGAGATAGNNPGGNGGATSLGTLLQIGGGNGGAGTAGSPSTIVAQGGASGTATTGDVLTVGQPGFPGGYFAATINLTGAGGNSHFGYGAVVQMITQAGGTGAGVAGTGYGGGGGGAWQIASASSSAGGAGTAGIIMITEFIST
jgi:hypothetical protein